MAGHDQNPTIEQLPNRDIKYTYSSYQNVKDVQCSYNYRLLVCVFNIYYTDDHNVDEDMRSISVHGGYWPRYDRVGITQREMDDVPTNVLDSVASKNNTLYGFKCLNIKTSIGLYITYYSYTPLLSKSDIDKLKPRGCVTASPPFYSTNIVIILHTYV